MKYKGILALVAGLSLLAVPSAFAQSGGPVTVQGTDPSTGAVVNKVGDTTNNALRIRIVASDVSSAGGTSSSFGSAFPASGTAAGFSDGTNMQAARVVDLDTGAGTQYGMINNLVRRASGGSVELIGQGTMANSLPVAIASDQGNVPINNVQIGGVALSTGNGVVGTGVQRVAIASDNTAFSVNAVQSGTWTVQPGNTANTTQWLVKSGPFDACGTTTYDPASVKIPDATLDVLTATTTCVETIALTNVSAASATITVQDTQGTPVQFANALPIAPGATVVFNNLGGLKFASGIKYQASIANAISIWVKGRQ